MCILICCHHSVDSFASQHTYSAVKTHIINTCLLYYFHVSMTNECSAFSTINKILMMLISFEGISEHNYKTNTSSTTTRLIFFLFKLLPPPLLSSIVMTNYNKSLNHQNTESIIIIVSYQLLLLTTRSCYKK